MKIYVLASGSKGNSTFIDVDGHGILIDCGIAKRRLINSLNELGYEFSDIHTVLLTHDHNDHNKNIHIFDKNILYAGKNTVEGLINVIEPYQLIELDNINILPLALSHDANSPMAYIISYRDEKLVYMTDTGYVNKKNTEYIKNASYYIIESNHDVEMLMDTNRPQYLIERILSDFGHMSNEYSATLMANSIGENTKEIILAHLSSEANTPKKAVATYKKVFKKHQIDINSIILKVASQQDIVCGGKQLED